MQSTRSANSSWRQLLAAPAPASHILQIYDCGAFLERAVAHYAAEGLHRAEAVHLIGTAAHLDGVDRALRASGVDTAAAVRSGQLVLGDVHDMLAIVAPGGMLDETRFSALTDEAIGRAATDTRFSGVRWWGEITNTLYQRGHAAAGLRAEELGDIAARTHGVTVFCSFLCDRFDAHSYRGHLHDLCCVHTHVIPAEDYASHRLAVNRAVREVVGELRGTMLQSLASWKGMPFEAPSSQALLFWLRDVTPQHFEAVLERARAHQQAGSYDQAGRSA